MRTDSVMLASVAVEEIRELIGSKYGADNVPDQPRTYKTKSKNAQEAHEAIRPTSATRIPSSIKRYLSTDQAKHYYLIWKRTVACQMVHATIDTVAADLTCGAENNFRATGSTIAHPGFMAVYLEGKDDSKESDDQESFLPPLTEGRMVEPTDIIPGQHFTEPKSGRES